MSINSIGLSRNFVVNKGDESKKKCLYKTRDQNMAIRKTKIDKTEDGVEHIFVKSDARVESGCDSVQADW